VSVVQARMNRARCTILKILRDNRVSPPFNLGQTGTSNNTGKNRQGASLPGHCTEGSTASKGTANPGVHTQPAGSRARGPRPGGEPEDNSEGVADESDDAVEGPGRYPLPRGRTTVDGETQDGLEGSLWLAFDVATASQGQGGQHTMK
jgi:hypothetical protein